MPRIGTSASLGGLACTKTCGGYGRDANRMRRTNVVKTRSRVIWISLLRVQTCTVYPRVSAFSRVRRHMHIHQAEVDKHYYATGGRPYAESAFVPLRCKQKRKNKSLFYTVLCVTWIPLMRTRGVHLIAWAARVEAQSF